MLNDKWERVRWIMYVQGFIYASFLIFITLYAVTDEDEDDSFLYIAFGINFLLVFYELYQIVASGWDY